MCFFILIQLCSVIYCTKAVKQFQASKWMSAAYNVYTHLICFVCLVI